MAKNFFLLFFRNLRRQRLFTTINLLGLSVSIASTLIIYVYVRQELSYDQFHSKADRIYRVNQTFIWGESDHHQFASTGPGVAFALRDELPEIELISRLHTRGDLVVTNDQDPNSVKSFVEEHVLVADSNFFQMFNFPMIQGDPNTALRLAQTVVLSESMARKYFGDQNPIGQRLKIGTAGDQMDCEVTGVVKDRPENTYIEFDFLLSMASFPVISRMSWSWVWTQLETFVRFREGTNMDNTLIKLQEIPKKHAEETLRRAMNITYDEYIKSGKKWELFLQPLTAIHLPKETVYNRIATAGNITVVYALIGSAFFIVLLSCVNFMNLSMAQFLRRMKEAGIRKVLGINRATLIWQYILEALVFCALGAMAGIAMVEFLLPAFNTLSGKLLTFQPFTDQSLLLAILGLTLLMGLMSGIYPALYLTSFNPVRALKGKLGSGENGKALRNGMVVFQFSTSIVLILCTAIVFQQLNFINTKDVGFDKENLLVLNNVEGVKSREALADAVRNLSGVQAATRATSLPPYLWGGDTFTASGMNNRTFNMNFTTIDEHFIPALRVRLLYGRNFSADIPADTTRVILNEAAIQRIGWDLDESVIGKKIEYEGATSEVIGVVSDFNYWPLQVDIEPMGLFHIKSAKLVGEGPKEFIGMRIQAEGPDQWKSLMGQLESIWKQHTPSAPFEYQFMDDNFSKSFKTEEQFGKALTVMAVLAILIAGLGLLGMIVYSLELRTKEIGIRKVSGASTWNIMVLISAGYTYLILAAFLIGAPLTWWLMNQWLSTFAYRVEPSPWLFAGVGIGTMAIAIAITSYHSMKAASTNPVDVLKDE